MTPAGTALIARGAGRAVGGRWLARDVDASFAPGSFTAIIGPNGSGKTTLLRLLAGITAPSAGVVELDGRPIRALPRNEIACWMSYLPQEVWVGFEVTVRDAVAMGRLPHLGAWRPMTAADADAVDAALARVDLEGFENRTLPTLSGGERQRVFLARALAQGSPILVLDEPTSALDVGHQLELMEILAALHGEGRTIVAAMHDLDLVWDYAPASLLLDHGRVCAQGSTREVLTSRAAAEAFGVTLTPRDDGSLAIARAPAPTPRGDTR